MLISFWILQTFVEDQLCVFDRKRVSDLEHDTCPCNCMECVSCSISKFKQPKSSWKHSNNCEQHNIQPLTRCLKYEVISRLHDHHYWHQVTTENLYTERAKTFMNLAFLIHDNTVSLLSFFFLFFTADRMVTITCVYASCMLWERKKAALTLSTNQGRSITLHRDRTRIFTDLQTRFSDQHDPVVSSVAQRRFLHIDKKPLKY